MTRISRGEFEVLFSRHALKRAVERGIYWDFVRNTIFSGEIRRLGGGFVWFIKRFRRGTVVCKARMLNPSQVLVVTIEWRR